MKKSLLLYILFLSCCLIQVRDVSAQATPASSQLVPIPSGKIVEKVSCAQSPTQSYAVYLPSSYTPARSWPILYAFDPGARGPLPVTRFHEAAKNTAGL